MFYVNILFTIKAFFNFLNFVVDVIYMYCAESF